MKNSLMAGGAVSAFAHLLGISKPGAAVAEEDDDHAEAAAVAEEDDSDDKEPKGSKKSKKAKGDSDDEDEPDDADEDTASAEDEDMAAEEDDDKTKGRKAERARWAKVLKSPAAGAGRTAAACEMLANTDMKASAIVATLQALPAGATAPGLRERMAGVRRPKVGSEEASGEKPTLAQQIVAAAAKARGQKA